MTLDDDELADFADNVEQLLHSPHGPRLARLITSIAKRRPLSSGESDFVLAIQVEVAKLHGLVIADLLGRGQSATVARARTLAMYIVRVWTDASYPEIGRAFGRDHTTVIAACERAKNLRDADGTSTAERVMAKLYWLRNRPAAPPVAPAVREDTTRC